MTSPHAPNLSRAARLATWVVRHRIKPALGDLGNVARIRRAFAQPLLPPWGVRYTAAVVGGVAGEWVEARHPAARAEPGGSTTLLYLHGGAFIACSPRTHRALTASLARRGLRVFVPDYRLAPEHPFPAAVQDARAVWQALRQATPGRLVVAGDSAGGNLAMGLMLGLREAGEPLPDCAVLFSPVLDLTGGSDSLSSNARRDAMFPGDKMLNLRGPYLGEADPAQPLASPLLHGLQGLPPLLVHVGEDECLRDDSLRLAEQARAAGVRVQLRVWPGVFHVWQLAWWLPEARRSLNQAAAFLRRTARHDHTEHHDVLIVGAGLSGIGAAAQLQMRSPASDFALLEARAATGGTWDLFRYPGVRSDSDMYTLGYGFKPWVGDRPIGDGATIRDYVRQTATERGIHRHIRLGHRVVSAAWSSPEGRWTLEVAQQQADGSTRLLRMSCRLMMCCSGYYRYDHGHRPAFAGEADYTGRTVHPQHWPADLDHRGQRVLVIGSGATAITLVPALATSARHVTMLQRSPSYVVALPARDAIASALQRLLPARWASPLVRAKNVLLGMLLFQWARRRPAQLKALLVKQARAQLGGDAALAAHFTPRYAPWDQRLCVAPDGDIFQAIRSGRASVVTGEIERFTPQGVRLVSGEQIEADIIVTATGLVLNTLGDMQLSVDGRPVAVAQTMAYKGVMLSGVPNLTYTFGYTNASWTLKADLSARWACRLLRHLDRHGLAQAVAPRDPGVPARPFIDFSSGYVQRGAAALPLQGTRGPWRVHQNYLADLVTLRFGRLDDGVLQFPSMPPPRTPRPRRAGPALHRLQLRLCAARRGRAAAAGHPRPLAGAPELPGRPGHPALRAAGRWRAAIPLNARRLTSVLQNRPHPSTALPCPLPPAPPC